MGESLGGWYRGRQTRHSPGCALELGLEHSGGSERQRPSMSRASIRQKLLGLVDVLKTGSAAEARGWDRKRVAVTEGPGGSERHVEGMSEPHPSSSAAMKA